MLHAEIQDEFTSLIKNRIKNFWGYGNLESDIWFVGMEEGYSEKEILIDRFRVTSHAQVVDMHDVTADPGHKKWFSPNAPTQSTWRPLIYMLLYLENGTESTLDEIREFQINHFARSDSDHASLELMPLPSKTVKEKDWLYGETGIEGLATRAEYIKKYKPERVKALQHLIEKYHPKLVVFYSKTYFPEWKEIVPKPFQEIPGTKLHITENNTTVYAVVPHPTSFGVSGEDWKLIAEKLRKKVAA